MAPLPARKPRLRLPRHEPGAGAPGLPRPLLILAAAIAAYLAFRFTHRLAVSEGVAVSRATKAVHPALRAALAGLGLFALGGFGVVRLALPDRLRAHEPLWYLPTGAVTAALALTALGYLHVPFTASLAATLGAGGILAAYAVRRRGLIPRATRLPSVGWALYVAALLAFVVLIPLLRADFATVIGDGSDAHLAAGSAEFLRHHPPTSFHVGGPVDALPLQWRSKAPILYVLAAVSSLSGLQSFQVLSTVQALMLGMTLIGFFLYARETLGAGLAAAVAAAGLVGLDRMVTHTIMHPYYNQTWGMFTIPFGLVLTWLVLGTPRVRSRGCVLLLLLFLAVCAFAYPLAAPIPVLAGAFFMWRERRARRRAGEPVRSIAPRALWRRIYHGPRSLLAIVPIAIVLLVPLRGVFEKLTSGWNVIVDPRISLKGWGGDLGSYFPEGQFVSLPSSRLLAPALVLMAAGAWLALRRRPEPLRWGIVAVLVLGAVGALWFRIRPHGYYFEFKLLAFTGPVLVATAAVGFSRLRAAGAVVLALWLVLAYGATRAEVSATQPELSASMIDLQRLDRSLPAGASIRLDMDPALQLWTAWMLASHPLCSQTPVLDTAYPHVPESRKADYILVDYQMGHPFDAAGPPVRRIGGQFRLYRERPDTPGVDRCSTRRVQTVTSLSGS